MAGALIGQLPGAAIGYLAGIVAGALIPQRTGACSVPSPPPLDESAPGEGPGEA